METKKITNGKTLQPDTTPTYRKILRTQNVYYKTHGCVPVTDISMSYLNSKSQPIKEGPRHKGRHYYTETHLEYSGCVD